MIDYLTGVYFEGRDDFDVFVATLYKAYIYGAVDALLAILRILEDAPSLTVEELKHIIATTVNETMMYEYKEVNVVHNIFNRAFLALQSILKKEGEEAQAPQTQNEPGR